MGESDEWCSVVNAERRGEDNKSEVLFTVRISYARAAPGGA
jgi:hypothetical protein